MVIRYYKAYTPGTRNRSVSQFEEIFQGKPEKKLTSGQHRKKGRNHQGIITSRHRGGGHKRLYRHIDFRRNKQGIIGEIQTIEYDPNRKARICLTKYSDGEKDTYFNHVVSELETTYYRVQRHLLLQEILYP